MEDTNNQENGNKANYYGSNEAIGGTSSSNQFPNDAYHSTNQQPNEQRFERNSHVCFLLLKLFLSETHYGISYYTYSAAISFQMDVRSIIYRWKAPCSACFLARRFANQLVVKR